MFQIKYPIPELHLILMLGLEPARVDSEDLLEAVHVELAHERCHVRVLVVVREKLCRECGLRIEAN